MAVLPRVLFALLLILPGGFVIGPVVLLLKRWHDRRVIERGQSSAATMQIVGQPTAVPQPPTDTRPIEPTRAAA